MEGLLNKAEYLIEKSHEILIQGRCESVLGQPLYRKLAEIYADEAAKSPRLKSISLTHKLLEKLVKKENLNYLVINLYKGNEGFSIGIKPDSGVETETIKLSYEDDELLSYIDSEQLPPMLLDLLDEANVDVFYSGCIIAEIKDYRRSLDSSYESKYILLKPTTQSLLADIAVLTRDKDWTASEKMYLEAELVKRTAPPLNLSPSPIVALINNKLHQHKFKLSGVQLRKAARRFSQVSQNRQKKFEEASNPLLKLQGFLSERKEKRPLPKSISKPSIPMSSEELNVLGNAFEAKGKQEAEKFFLKVSEEVKKVAQPLDRPSEPNDNNTLFFVEEYTLETERGQGRIYLTKLTLSQRRTDEIYFGELYVDRDYQEGKQNGSICRFQLGNLYQVQRYIKQFKEILTEEGRKTVKITHKVAGQTPRVVHTPGSRDKKDIADQVKQAPQPQTLPQTQQQQLKQNLITTFNLTNQNGVAQIPLSTAATPGAVIGGMNLTQGTPQNVIIVSNADGSLTKKSVSVVAKPITVTSTASLSNLLAAQPTNQANVGQQLVVGQSVNLANLLNSRQLVTGRPIAAAGVSIVGSAASIPGQALQSPKGVVVSSVTGGGAKISMPNLAAQLNRPAPAYSQAVVSSKNQQQIVSQTLCLSDSQVLSKGDVSSSGSLNPNSNLQALLAGSSTENSTLSRNQTLLERLTAQSVMLNNPNKEDGSDKIEVSIANQTTTSALNSIPQSATALIRAENSGIGPPNINLANITNLPGLNVGLQNLATNISGVQNVQVSIPGFAVPISLSLNVPGSVHPTSSSSILVSSPSVMNNAPASEKSVTAIWEHSDEKTAHTHSHPSWMKRAVVTAKTSGTTAVNSSGAAVMIASSGLQQRQLVQLPLSQLSGTQLGAQLSKSVSQGATGPSGIPVLQVQSVGGNLFTPVRNNQTALAGVSTATGGGLAPQTVQVAVPSPQGIATSGGDITFGNANSSSSAQIGSSIVTLTSKQPLTMAKQPSGQLTWQLQQKLMAAKRQQQQLLQNPPK